MTLLLAVQRLTCFACFAAAKQAKAERVLLLAGIERDIKRKIK
jgi:hypothetical protein